MLKKLLLLFAAPWNGTVEDDDGPKGPSGQSASSRHFIRIVEQADETPQQSGSLLDSPFSVSLLFGGFSLLFFISCEKSMK